MMKKERKIRNKWLHIRLDEDELKQVFALLARTNEKKLGRYARKIILKEPVTIIQRNGSLDELISILVKVQNDLNGVANNYNQMVHKLHMADSQKEIRSWLSFYENEKGNLFKTIDEVKSVITQGAKKWLQ